MFLNTHSPPIGTFNFRKDSEEEHDEFTERLRKTLYYGKLPGTDRPSMPLTDMAVEFFQEAAPRKLGRLDTYLAASTSRSACMTPTSVMAGMMYVNRLRKRQPEYLTQISSSELFLISMMLASKFLYDEGIDEEVFNDEWAAAGDLDTEEVNELERDFLQAIDWQLFIRPDEFSEMLNTVEKRIALSQGLKRGWFSYTDLCVLSKDLKFMTWQDLSLELSKVLSVSSLAYLASVLMMIGSTVLGTTASTALVNSGASLLPTHIYLPDVSSILPHGLLASLSSKEIAAVDIANISNSDFLLPRLLTGEEMRGEQRHMDRTSQQFAGTKINEDDNGNEERVDVPSREQGSFMNGFLPPFLALVALKDTLVKFAYAVTEKAEVALGKDPINTKELPEVCSVGPCLMDSWPNCWNVSSEFDWSEFKSFHAKCSTIRDCQNSYESYYPSSLTDFHLPGHCLRSGKVGQLGLMADRTSGVHCCCKWPPNSPQLDYVSVSSQLPDLTYGFITSSILITA